jgi:hypothetical protein
MNVQIVVHAAEGAGFWPRCWRCPATQQVKTMAELLADTSESIQAWLRAEAS